MSADVSAKPNKAVSRGKRRISRRVPDRSPFERMKKALDKAYRDSRRLPAEAGEPDVPKGVQEESLLKTEADTPVRLPARDPLKIPSH